MKITINLDKLNPSFNQLVSQKLKEAGLPGCFGLMTLPLIPETEKFEDSDLLITTKTVGREQIATTELSSFIDGSEALLEGKALSIPGFKKLISRKEAIVTSYVDQAILCSKCKFTEVCNMLTKNTLESAKLLQIGEN
jgi:hypothetical protein